MTQIIKNKNSIGNDNLILERFHVLLYLLLPFSFCPFFIMIRGGPELTRERESETGP